MTTPAAASPQPAARRPVLAGREREQTLLREQLEAAIAGRGSLVLVGGEAGIGKTTLVEDLAARADDAGALALWGHAYDLTVTPPLRPLDRGRPPLPGYRAGAALPSLPR